MAGHIGFTMCGIAGIFETNAQVRSREEAERLVAKMTNSFQHRGPDGHGVWSDERGQCVLGHRRLSIIDTSEAGLQPFASNDGRWIITFNGEIYNFAEIKPHLEQAGVQFRGRTDTEVLVEAIALWGVSALERLDGMYAFAAYDTHTRELLIARDPFGEKPLYYTKLPSGGLAFASELQALEILPGFSGAVNIDALAEVLSFQYIGAPRSIYSSVHKLPPGHWMKITADGEIITQRYYAFLPGSGGYDSRPKSDLVDELEELLTRSLKRRLVSDVPLGAFLSGGVDSSTICALARRKLNVPLQTFSIGFRDAPESEHEIARQFAAHLGTEHFDDLVEPNAAEFLHDIGNILDEPNADSSCLPTYILSAFARKRVTVAISGDGGDELFGGYGRYFQTLIERDEHINGAHVGWQPGKAYYGNRILVATEPHIEELLEYLPRKFMTHLSDLRGDLNSASALLPAMRRSDVDNYMPGAVLPKVDRMSMQHSLEVRTPFLNMELARFAERLPDDVLVAGHKGKILLREIAYRYLPRNLIDMPKRGFGLPMSDWGRQSMLNVASSLLEADDSRLAASLGPQSINRFMTRQRSRDGFAMYQIWAVAMLESWLRGHPAVMPYLGDERARSRTPSVPETALVPVEAKGMSAWWIADGVCLATLDLGVNTARESVLRAADRVPVWVWPAILDLSLNCGGTKEVASLRIPDWNSPALGSHSDSAIHFKSSTLFFLNPDASNQLSRKHLLFFAKLGVRRIFTIHPHAQGYFLEIKLNGFGAIQRVKSAATLFGQRAASVARTRAVQLVTGSLPATHVSTRLWSAPELKGLQNQTDAELATAYGVYEGWRQLPPLPTGHAEIAELQGGRYSIWNQALLFSSTESRLSRWLPVWAVERTDKNEHLFEVTADSRSLDEILAHSAKAPSASLQQNYNPRSAALNPGDCVVLCTHALPAGGAERQWVYLAQELAARGLKPVVVVYSGLAGANGHYLPQLAAQNIPVIEANSELKFSELLDRLASNPLYTEAFQLNIVPDLGRLIGLAEAFRSVSPKAVIAQLDDPNIYAAFAAHLAQVPRVVLSFRNYNPTNFPYINNAWYQDAYRLAAKLKSVIFSGNHRGANDDYADWIGIARDRVAFIPNAIDPDAFPIPSDDAVHQVRKALGLQDGQPMVFGAFRFSAEKNPRAFIETCAQISAKVINARFFIAGTGPLGRELDDLSRELGLSDKLQFLGSRSDMNVLMRAANLLLLTSDKEGMPNVIMEAQLMETPVVATAVGGVVDVTIRDETAFLCAPGDVNALAAACISLLENPARAKAMGKAGRQFMLQAFPRSIMAQRYVELIDGEHPASPNEAPNLAVQC